MALVFADFNCARRHDWIFGRAAIQSSASATLEERRNRSPALHALDGHPSGWSQRHMTFGGADGRANSALDDGN